MPASSLPAFSRLNPAASASDVGRSDEGAPAAALVRLLEMIRDLHEAADPEELAARAVSFAMEIEPAASGAAIVEVRDDRIRILAATGMCEDAPTVDCPRLLAAEATPHSFPLVVRGRSLGALRIVMRGATEVSPAVRDLLGSLASHAAIALDSWRRLTGCEVAAARSASEFTRGIEVHREERDQAVTGSEIARAALGGRGARDSSLDMLRVLERVLAVNGAALALVRGSSSDAAHDQLLLASSRSSDSADGLVVEWLAATGAAALLAGMELEAGSSIASMLSNPGVPYDVSGAAWTGVDRVEAIGGSIHGGLGDEIAAELDAISCENVLAMSLAAHEQIVGVVLVTLESGDDTSAAGEALERLAAPLTLAMDAMVRELELQRRRAHERMLATALATLADPVLLLDDRGRIRGANAAARETYGYSGAELLEMKLSQLVVKAPASGEALPATSVRPHLLPNETPAFTPVVDSVFRIRQEHRRKDGSAFPASLVRAPVVDAAGRPAGEVVLVRELTNEQRMEAHLRQHDRLAALGELVAGVAHELNNPLTGISAFAQLLLEDPLSEEQLESVRLVKREADRATAVVRDLLLFSRNTGSRLAALDLNDLVRSTVRLRAYHLNAGGIELTLELAERLPLINGDEQKLQQVLLHLIGNAEEALHGAKLRSITVRTLAESDRVILEVHDTGHGMSERARMHAFEPFFTTKGTGAGRGLGLSVSYGIIEAHGGLLTVDSTPGRHTTVRVLLPLPADSAYDDCDR